MSFLNKVSKGRIKKNEFVLCFGAGGLGKSSFGAEAPSPIFLPVEEGSNSLNVARFPKPASYDEAMAMLRELPVDDYKTLVFDSLDHFEPLVWEKTVSHFRQFKEFENVTTIESFGYGKGYVLATEFWSKFLQELIRIREKMHVVLISHSKVKQINDPLLVAPYDKHVIKLQDRATALIKETVDTVLFLNTETHVKVERNKEKGKAFGEGQRYFYTSEMPGHDAKNRDGLPYEIKADKGKMWSAYMTAKSLTTEDDPKPIKDLILKKIPLIKDADLKSKVEAATQSAGEDRVALQKVLTRLEQVITH